MSFQLFAETHGLIISHLVTDKWVRVPTVDKPHSKNGAYFFDGQSGAVQNWAIHEKPVSWRDKDYKPDPFAAEKREKARKIQAEKQEKARKKAGFIMNNTIEKPHPYMARKGFPRQKVYVWNDLLVLPMRIDGKLVGCQLISEDGTKKFLSGQVTKGASLVIDNKGMDIVCEGFATGMSIRNAMRHLKMRYKIHICFSAANMIEISKGLHDPFVVADNDPVGIRTAQKIGNYWVSDKDGEDFNDAEQRLGVEEVSQSLLTAIERAKA